MTPLLIVALFLPWQNPPSEKCSLSGTVVSSVTGEALNKVELLLAPADHRGIPAAVTESDAEGHFALADLDPGRYYLRGTRNGFLETSYGVRGPGRESIVQLEKGQSLDHLRFQLIPGAVLSGTVRDSDGEPLEGASVTLARMTNQYGKPRVEGYDSTETDDRGEYRFRSLVAGKYYVAVEPRARGGNRVDHSSAPGPTEMSIRTFYPNSTSPANAAPVTVVTGTRVNGIDITLIRSRVFRVSGRVTNISAGEHFRVTLHDPRNSIGGGDMSTATRNAAGEFEFRGVPPGIYEMSAGDQARHAKVSISVGVAAVEDVRLTLSPGAEVQVRLAVEDPAMPEPPGLQCYLTADGRNGFLAPFEKDRIHFSNVPPEHYALNLFGKLPPGYYFKEARAGDADVLEGGLTVEGAGNIEITLAIGSGGAAVEGVVRDSKQQPVAGATVLLAPDRRSRPDLFLNVTTDQNGRYVFATVAPGAYKLFAWEEVEPDAWNDPDFVADYEKQGQKLALEPKQHTGMDLVVVIPPERR